MQENLDTNQMDELASEGWAQMKDLLQKHGLEEKKKPTVILWVYRIGGLAASILLAIVAYTFFFNSGPDQKTLANVEKEIPNISSSKHENTISNLGNKSGGTAGSIPLKNESPGLPQISQTTSASKINIQNVLQSSKTIYIPVPGQAEIIKKAVLTTYARKIQKEEKLRNPLPINNVTLKNPLLSSFKKTETNSEKRSPVEIYAGAGLNISGKRKDQPGFDISQINIHPSIRIVFPLSKKLSLNTGLSAFSSLKAQNATTEEKELVNDVNANLYYTINKASILKASYFEVPVTINYHISRNWTAGAGLELSRLYQFKIKETEKTYDYNENLTATNLDRNLIISTLAAPAKKDKISLKKWNPGMVLETTFKTGSFLISAGYHYGLSPSITTVEANGTTKNFKNEYFKVGIQYQVK